MAVIGTIRQKLGGLLIVVIAVAMFAFILMDMGGKGSNGSGRSESFAKVNGEEVSYTEFNDRVKINETYFQNQMQGQPLDDQQKDMVVTNTFNEIIGEKLKAKLYKDLGLELGQAEKRAMLFEEQFQHPSIKSSFAGEDGKFSQENFMQYLNTLDAPDKNFAEGEKRAQWTNFEKAIYKEKVDSKYNKLLTESTKVPSWMAKALYNNDNTKANIEYVYFPYSEVPNESISFTDNDLNAYLSKHANAYQQEASVSLKYLVYPIVPSPTDIQEVRDWMTENFASWKAAESDSLFIMGRSETRWDATYKSKSELQNQFADSIFSSSVGSFFGPVNTGKQIIAYKLIDRKAIPDSVKVNQILITGEGLTITTAEEFDVLLDSLITVIRTGVAPFSAVAAQYSKDPEVALNGGDKGWVRPGEQPYSNDVFFKMNRGELKVVRTQFGAFIVQPYEWGTTQTGVKLATLSRSIFASEETTNAIFAEASAYSGNNRNKESFIAGSDKLKDALNVNKTASTLQGLSGNARSLVRWAFNANQGEVSAPEMVGENFVVALVNGKFEKGNASLENVRALLEAEVIKEKKAALLKAKITGSDLSAIASSNSKSVQTANNISFSNFTIGSAGNEPLVAGAALGLPLNGVSKPIVGENGVYMVKTTSKTDAVEPTDLSKYTNSAASYAGTIQSKLLDAMKKGAKMEDNSAEYL